VIISASKTLTCGISPQSNDDEIHLQLSVYDCIDASEMIKVASCPVFKYSQPMHGFQVASPNYDAERDILRIAVDDRNFVELKLKKYVVDSGYANHIPSFV